MSPIQTLSEHTTESLHRADLGSFWYSIVSISSTKIRETSADLCFRGFSANLVVYNTAGELPWRLQLGSAVIPAIPLVFGVYACPGMGSMASLSRILTDIWRESPRWYLKKGRYTDAYRSLLRLRRTPLQATRDLYYCHVQLTESSEPEYGSRNTSSISNYFKRLRELFQVRRIRSATLAAFVVMIAQQMCGINIIAFYSSSVASDAGYSNKGALLMSFGFGIVNFLASLGNDAPFYHPN